MEGEPNEGLFYEVDEVVRYRVSFAFVDLDLGNTLEQKRKSKGSIKPVRPSDRHEMLSQISHLQKVFYF